MTLLIRTVTSGVASHKKVSEGREQAGVWHGTLWGMGCCQIHRQSENPRSALNIVQRIDIGRLSEPPAGKIPRSGERRDPWRRPKFMGHVERSDTGILMPWSARNRLNLYFCRYIHRRPKIYSQILDHKFTTFLIHFDKRREHVTRSRGVMFSFLWTRTIEDGPVLPNNRV